MNKLNLVAVPNGVFSLEEALDDSLIKEAVKLLQSAEVSTTAKIKTFLIYYQMLDTLAQLHMQGFDLNEVNEAGLKESMKYAIDVGYDSIIKTFPKHQRKKLNELFKQAPAH
ncbi:hypothetical protein [Niveibacterium sp.]|uniref:hypothetical protein n=1 Tax=Niveibacterium sp. TaxID=2017444 RepID=UPI0035B4564C